MIQVRIMKATNLPAMDGSGAQGSTDAYVKVNLNHKYMYMITHMHACARARTHTHTRSMFSFSCRRLFMSYREALSILASIKEAKIARPKIFSNVEDV